MEGWFERLPSPCLQPFCSQLSHHHFFLHYPSRILPQAFTWLLGNSYSRKQAFFFLLRTRGNTELGIRGWQVINTWTSLSCQKINKNKKKCATLPCSRSLCSTSQSLTDPAELQKLEMEKDNLHPVPSLWGAVCSLRYSVLLCSPKHIASIWAEYHGVSSPIS